MTKHEYKKTAYDLIYIIICVLNNRNPSREKLDKMDLSQLFEVAQDHSLNVIVAYALECLEIYDERFIQAKAKAVRNSVYYKIERDAILNEFERAKIWYMPLKGIILKDFYPKISMREMTDNDFLIDKKRREDIKKIMIAHGFYIESYNTSKHDVYYKKPVCNFQMHLSLFDYNPKPKLYKYFEHIDKRLISDKVSEYGRQFTNEDFYIYIKSHEFNHYSTGGTGLRSLLDTYVYIKQYDQKLDWNYLGAEFKKLQMSEYEMNSRILAQKVFEGITLNEDENKLLDYYIYSGKYGTQMNRKRDRIERNNGHKFMYIINRVFIPISWVEIMYPLFYKYKFLIPFLPLYRMIKSFQNKKQKKLIGDSV